jgi:hypothetical protein
LIVEVRQSGFFDPEQLHELRDGGVQSACGVGHVEFMEMEVIHRFGQQCGKVVVFWAQGNASFGATGPPQFAWLAGTQFGSNEYCQIDAQATNRPASIFVLAASFAGPPRNSGRKMVYFDSRFDFVSMLAPWPGGFRSRDPALRE